MLIPECGKNQLQGKKVPVSEAIFHLGKEAKILRPKCPFQKKQSLPGNIEWPVFLSLNSPLSRIPYGSLPIIQGQPQKMMKSIILLYKKRLNEWKVKQFHRSGRYEKRTS